ncbi:MAG TPA: NAD-dependent epimerase/dehydratase family protein [Kofleriaceae bacterium]|jgi:nucleoside-diphosphate-sugar epimerase|nr:NAD-dependent epimerase/dehydratase family protein [Kofleriaceae bacterium]
MQRAFVTGGSGFVGGRLITALRAQSVEVCALARSDKSTKAVQALGATAARGDLDDAAALQTGMHGCDVVFHCAAHTDQFDPLDVHMRITTRGTENTLSAARAAGAKRFIHVSTEAVLADGKPIIRVDETKPLPKKPMGAYPITKGLAEAAVLAANRDGLETVIVRPRFVWGKGDTNLLPEFIEAVKAGKYAWISGGHYLTSTTHVDNVVEGLLLAAEKGKPGEIYFVTDGAPSEFREFITKLLATQNMTAPSRSIPHWLGRTVVALTSWMKRPPLTATAFSLMAHEVTIDDSKARRELGYQGSVSLERGFADMRPT